MSLVDEFEEELQATADREAFWRSRSIDLVSLILEHECDDALVDHAKETLAALKAERSLPLYGRPQAEPQAFRGVVVVTEAIERQIESQAEPPVPAPAQIEAPAIESVPVHPDWGPVESESDFSRRATHGRVRTDEPQATSNATSKRAVPRSLAADGRLAVDGFKVCKSCRERKPVSAYTNHPHTADKLDPNCKACKYAKTKARRLAKSAQTASRETRPETEPPVQPSDVRADPTETVDIAPITSRKCRICERTLPLDQFMGPALNCRFCVDMNQRAQAQMRPAQPAGPKPKGDVEQARALYWEHLSAGGVCSNQIEGAIMAETGVTRTTMLAIRDELLKKRKPGTVAKADRAASQWDTTPPYQGPVGR